MNETTIDTIVASCEIIRKKYPEAVLLKTAIKIAEELQVSHIEHIAKKRDEMRRLKSFKEKQDYYQNVLANREWGYKLITERLTRFLESPAVKPYEAWVTEATLADMKRKGYKAVVLDELILGNVIMS